jgi:medium-chain acyl-[acyl-carrier-protein] hydrolase
MALTLICFPYAGGGASVYRGWPGPLRPDVDVVAAALPGREARFSERPIAQLRPLVEQMTRELLPRMGAPYALFGHSMGALLAFEVAREMRRRGGPAPTCLIASGHRAPHLPDRDPPIHALPDEEFVEELRDYGGTPEQVLAEPELMELLIPLLRADFSVCETYQHQEEAPLDCPLWALGGTDDERVTQDELEAWCAHTRGEFRAVHMPGGHFFLNEQRAEVLAIVREALARHGR